MLIRVPSPVSEYRVRYHSTQADCPVTPAVGTDRQFVRVWESSSPTYTRPRLAVRRWENRRFVAQRRTRSHRARELLALPPNDGVVSEMNVTRAELDQTDG